VLDDNGLVCGTVTDRDIVIRASGRGTRGRRDDAWRDLHTGHSSFSRYDMSRNPSGKTLSGSRVKPMAWYIAIAAS
jgi:hypothetical protein